MAHDLSKIDSTRGAAIMARAAADTADSFHGAGLPVSADRVWTAISGLSVRELALLHHFITIPSRED